VTTSESLLALAAPLGQINHGPPNAFHQWLESPLVKATLPIPVFIALAPLLWLLFRSTWREIDVEAQAARGHTLARGKWDPRAAVACLIIGVVLTMQDYYGGGRVYQTFIRSWLVEHEDGLLEGLVNVGKYDQLYGYAWWAFARVVGYVFIPLPLWKLLFPRDSLLDMGFRLKGVLRHWWIYGACLGLVLLVMLAVARQPDFGTYYPFYKLASRSWFDLLVWEALYFAQFLALEVFFRGWMLGAWRKTLGSGAIFAMTLPYCMIHYGKPYLEANGAILAGIFLGSLSMKTKSIYAGFLVHITVALLMDLLALYNRNALPTVLFTP
jgi:membrane protease YdiL (CAAX protease family)